MNLLETQSMKVKKMYDDRGSIQSSLHDLDNVLIKIEENST